MADTFSYPKEKYVLIGKVAKAHGIRGELKIFAFSGDGESITRHKKLTLVSKEGTILPAFSVTKARIAKKEVLVKLKGISDRNHAEELSAYGVLALKDDLPVLADNAFYLHELEGLTVKTVDDEIVGQVDSFFDNGPQDILVVKNGKNEILIPIIPGMIVKRDKEHLTIAPPPGLLEINSGDDGMGK
jgi:16S rRNA processing protein RimM